MQVWLLLVSSILAIQHVATEGKYEEALPEEQDIEVVEGQGPDMKILEEDDVLVLTESTFDYVVATRDPILVEFYAPWCTHCKTLAPEYAKAAKELKSEGIYLAKVDATVETLIAAKYQVQNYPTIKLFRKGEPAEEYDGPRNAVGLIHYLRQRSDPNYKPPPVTVITLTKDTFEDAVKPESLMLVQFYAPWCGHCKKFAPEFEAAAQELSRLHNIPLAAVDATADTELAQKYGVTGYPTLKVFRHGRPFEYKGALHTAGLISHMKEQQRLPSQEVRTALNARNAMPRTEPAVFGSFTSDQSDLYTEYIAAANDLRGDMSFIHTFDTSLAEAYGVGADSVAVLMPDIYTSQFEDTVRTMEQSGPPLAPAMVSWLRNASVPLLGERSTGNQATRYTARPLLVVYGAVDFSHLGVGATQHLRHKLLPLLHRHRDSFTFALSNEEQFNVEMESLGLGETGEDVNAAIFTDKQKYAMEPDEDYLEHLEEFISQFKAGKLKPYLKSQAVPALQTGPVKTIVAKSYEREVLSGNKDFLIEFYAPWCGHCKQFEPMYKQLAKQLASSHPHVVLAKFDATANDLPANFDVKGFPTLYYVKASDKEKPVLFTGDRSMDAIKEFVMEQSQSGGSSDRTEL